EVIRDYKRPNSRIPLHSGRHRQPTHLGLAYSQLGATQPSPRPIDPRLHSTVHTPRSQTQHPQPPPLHLLLSPASLPRPALTWSADPSQACIDFVLLSPAKRASIFIRLVSAAGTGFFYVKRKNPRRITEKLEFRKYDPRVNKHVLFTEAKMKIERMVVSRACDTDVVR
ncbi:hypothetical protein EJB05_36827, partial [Eragrostis curvula]